MNYLLEAFEYIGTNNVWPRIWEHLFYTFLPVGIAALIAFPIGIAMGHTGKGTTSVVAASNALRALPSLGVLTWLTLALALGIQIPLIPATIVLVILAVPPLLAAIVTGIAAIPDIYTDAARTSGHSEMQVIRHVELPLAASTMMGGLRSCVVQVLATATIVAYIGLGGLGRYLIDGLALRDYPQMLAGAVLVTALALLIDVLLGILQWRLKPKGLQ